MVMKQNIINARITFKKSPIHVLEKFAFKDMPNACLTFKKNSSVSECVIIQTCNRIELFAASDNPNIDKIKSTWASLTGQEESVFRDTLEVCENKDAYEHLLKLTSGLESLVVGEEQILGQIKESISVARQTRASGKRLNKLFDRSIRIGTRIRNSTGIGRGGISLGSMAVKLAEENVDDIKSKHVLLIGTGEAATMVAKSLKKRGYAFNVTSRTVERSIGFSQTLGGNPIKFEEVLSGFSNYEIIFVATTAPYFLVTFDKMKDAMKNKKSGTMILDLSNPRTVDEKVATIPGIKLMNIDQIAEMIDKNMKKRKDKVTTVENIISEEVPVIEATMKRLDAEPLVKDVFTNANSMRIKELQKALQMLGETDKKRIKIIDELTKAVVESIVSTPMNNLRRASEQGSPELLEIASKLFNYKKKE
ncbi:MAG TPA: glutamyl-tRNA reductase [Candidatus Nitrosopelagicus sp.]|nr:glutamyl-tRNA reductase [Candidatus Nitrosopelagicus sp.]